MDGLIHDGEPYKRSSFKKHIGYLFLKYQESKILDDFHEEDLCFFKTTLLSKFHKKTLDVSPIPF